MSHVSLHVRSVILQAIAVVRTKQGTRGDMEVSLYFVY